MTDKTTNALKLAEAIELSVKAEREACAKVCDEIDQRDDIHPDHVAIECAAAIRSRSDIVTSVTARSDK